MKNLILLFAITGLFVQAQAQKLVTKKVPEAITAAFTRDNPTIKVVDWNRSGNTYVAMFKANKMEVSISYDTVGKPIVTIMEIAVKDLPAPVMEYLKTNYKAAVVKKASKITNAEGVLTSYQLKTKELYLLFDSAGTFVKERKF